MPSQRKWELRQEHRRTPKQGDDASEAPLRLPPPEGHGAAAARCQEAVGQRRRAPALGARLLVVEHVAQRREQPLPIPAVAHVAKHNRITLTDSDGERRCGVASAAPGRAFPTWRGERGLCESSGHDRRYPDRRMALSVAVGAKTVANHTAQRLYRQTNRPGVRDRRYSHSSPWCCIHSGARR